MRTKALLSAAAALAVGIATSNAQVYSQNIVGYMSVNFTNGFNAFANQLDLDGTGTNNTILTVLNTNVPPGTKVEMYDPTVPGYRLITLNAAGTTWSAGTAGPFVQKALQPGGGVFVDIPGATPTNVTVTIVGNVLQQTNVVSLASQTFQMVSEPFPLSGFLTTNFNYAANAPVSGIDDEVEIWNPVTQLFQVHKFNGSAWSAGSPNLTAAESFFLIPNQATTWTNSFTAQ